MVILLPKMECYYDRFDFLVKHLNKQIILLQRKEAISSFKESLRNYIQREKDWKTSN